MNKAAIEKFAIDARNDLIAGVKQRAYQFGIDTNGSYDKNAISAHNVVFSKEEASQRQQLIWQIQNHGYEKTMEEVAYTWFNRFIALRFMEVNNYLPTHIRVFSDANGAFKPEILQEALRLDLDGIDTQKVADYLEKNQTEDLYRYLLLVQCNALHPLLPVMFDKLKGYMALLLPNNILKSGSILARLVENIVEEDFKDAVEIIGWMYQYYNTEPKAEVFAGLKKNVKITKDTIPAATQIFTPDWIVKYMVENSLGRLWFETHTDEELKAKWKYYLKEAPQEPEVQAQLDSLRAEQHTKLEEIKVIDPCMGSGHILVYVFDVLMQIYESQGYAARDAVSSILKNNLFGLDIDERAYQLAYFALMMKARSYDRRFLTRNIAPYVYCPKGYAEGEEYGSLLIVTELEEKPSERIDLLAHDYKNKLNTWNFRRLLAQNYDVVVTNPPYMGSSGMDKGLADYVKKQYPDSKNDFCTAFIERSNMMLKTYGYNAMVTMQSWMFLSSYEVMRKKLLKTTTISSLIQIGYNSFPEINSKVAQAVAFIVNSSATEFYKGTYLDLTNKYPQAYDKEQAFYKEQHSGYYHTQSQNFSKIPGSPIAYWISERLLSTFENEAMGKIAKPRQGLATGCNDLFVRQWYEVSIDKTCFAATSTNEALNIHKKWFPYNKGGEFRKWYGNNDYIVNWENDGILIKNFKNDVGKLRSRPQNTQFYFKHCISWSLISSGSIAFRYKPQGHIFDVAGMSCFSDKNLNYLLALCNSKISLKFLEILAPTINYQAGDIANIPVIINKSLVENIETITEQNISLSKCDWDAFETSWDFVSHPLTVGRSESLEASYTKWESECQDRFNTLKANEEELNRLFIDIYGLQDELTPEVEDKDVTVRLADKTRDIKSFISYAVGCMFGRYSLDVDGLAYAGGNWDTSKYSSFMPDADNIIPICDDEYFDDDLTGRFVSFVEKVFGKNTLEANLQFIADALGGTSLPKEIIRNYFLNTFYADHCKIYQKRPIYWQFESGKKNGFKALMYMHRYQPDLMARMRTDYVHEQQERYETQLIQIAENIEKTSGAERIKLGKLQKQLQEQSQEIASFEEKVHHLADQHIAIDLDDGVKHNYEFFQTVVTKIK